MGQQNPGPQPVPIPATQNVQQGSQPVVVQQGAGRPNGQQNPNNQGAPQQQGKFFCEL
jgi:hypothetical protein